MSGLYQVTAFFKSRCGTIYTTPYNYSFNITVIPKAVAPNIASSANSITLGQNVSLTGSGCANVSDLRWNYGMVGSTVSVSPTLNSTYWAYCATNGCSGASSNRIPISITNCLSLLNLISPTDDISNGTIIKEANSTTGTIEATNKLTSTANVTYRAGKSITLNAGFKADNGVVFKTEFGGCN